jgi:hypothetical protein
VALDANDLLDFHTSPQGNQDSSPCLTHSMFIRWIQVSIDQ